MSIYCQTVARSFTNVVVRTISCSLVEKIFESINGNKLFKNTFNKYFKDPRIWEEIEKW